MLETFGVGIDAETVYRAMLLQPDCGVEELAATLALSREQLLAALDDLADHALVAGVDTGPLSAVPPERAVETLLQREEAQLEARRAELRRSRESLPALVADYVGPRRTFVTDQIELLGSWPLVRSRLYQLAAEATQSAWAIHPGGPLSAEAIAAALPLDRELVGRGVSCRMIVLQASLGPDHWWAYLSELTRLGHQVRVAPSVTQRCVIVDGRVGVVPRIEDGAGGGYVIHGLSLVAPLIALFEELWNAGEPFVDTVAGEDKAVTEARMRQAAVLLARGLKDDALARRLGVSVRTVRRIIAATLAELQADSRFQAGVAAVRKGWIDVDADA